MREQTVALRSQWDQQVDGLEQKIRAMETGFEKQQDELRQHTEQRMDDVELLQRTISTTQEQQVRLRATMEETMQAAKTDVRALSASIDQVERTLSSTKVDMGDIRRQQADLERDSRLQFENAHRVFRVFSEALQIKVPIFEPPPQRSPQAMPRREPIDDDFLTKGLLSSASLDIARPGYGEREGNADHSGGESSISTRLGGGGAGGGGGLRGSSSSWLPGNVSSSSLFY